MENPTHTEQTTAGFVGETQSSSLTTTQHQPEHDTMNTPPEIHTPVGRRYHTRSHSVSLLQQHLDGTSPYTDTPLNNGITPNTTNTHRQTRHRRRQVDTENVVASLSSSSDETGGAEHTRDADTILHTNGQSVDTHTVDTTLTVSPQNAPTTTNTNITTPTTTNTTTAEAAADVTTSSPSTHGDGPIIDIDPSEDMENFPHINLFEYLPPPNNLPHNNIRWSFFKPLTHDPFYAYLEEDTHHHPELRVSHLFTLPRGKLKPLNTHTMNRKWRLKNMLDHLNPEQISKVGQMKKSLQKHIKSVISKFVFSLKLLKTFKRPASLKSNPVSSMVDRLRNLPMNSSSSVTELNQLTDMTENWVTDYEKWHFTRINKKKSENLDFWYKNTASTLELHVKHIFNMLCNTTLFTFNDAIFIMICWFDQPLDIFHEKLYNTFQEKHLSSQIKEQQQIATENRKHQIEEDIEQHFSENVESENLDLLRPQNLIKIFNKEIEKQVAQQISKITRGSRNRSPSPRQTQQRSRGRSPNLRRNNNSLSPTLQKNGKKGRFSGKKTRFFKRPPPSRTPSPHSNLSLPKNNRRRSFSRSFSPASNTNKKQQTQTNKKQQQGRRSQTQQQQKQHQQQSNFVGNTDTYNNKQRQQHKPKQRMNRSRSRSQNQKSRQRGTNVDNNTQPPQQQQQYPNTQHNNNKQRPKKKRVTFKNNNNNTSPTRQQTQQIPQQQQQKNHVVNPPPPPNSGSADMTRRDSHRRKSFSPRPISGQEKQNLRRDLTTARDQQAAKNRQFFATTNVLAKTQASMNSVHQRVYIYTYIERERVGKWVYIQNINTRNICMSRPIRYFHMSFWSDHTLGVWSTTGFYVRFFYFKLFVIIHKKTYTYIPYVFIHPLYSFITFVGTLLQFRRFAIFDLVCTDKYFMQKL